MATVIDIPISELTLDHRVETARNKFSTPTLIEPSRRGSYVKVELNNGSKFVYDGYVGKVRVAV